MVWPILGCRTSGCFCTYLLNNNLAGGTPVVECGVVQCLNKKRETFDSIVLYHPLYSHFKCLHWPLCHPFDDGWYGEVQICVMPFALINSANSWLVKADPLSVTTVSERPIVEKVLCALLGVQGDSLPVSAEPFQPGCSDRPSWYNRSCYIYDTLLA